MGLTVIALDIATNDSDMGMTVEIVNQVFDRVLYREGIGVESVNILGGTIAVQCTQDGNVVARTIASVIAGGNNFDTLPARMVGLLMSCDSVTQLFKAAILRIVIDNCNFPLTSNTLEFSQRRRDRVKCHLRCFVVYYHRKQFHANSLASASRQVHPYRRDAGNRSFFHSFTPSESTGFDVDTETAETLVSVRDLMRCRGFDSGVDLD